MLTFFRRIRKGLLGQGAVPKYLLYVIGEIALVVIGILIALQINNWNERQKNIIVRNDLLNSVHFEFLANKEKLNITKQGLAVCFENSSKLMEMFPINVKTVDLDTMRARIRGSYGDWTFEPLGRRINYLLNSPAFELIEDEELKTILLSWESVYEDYREDEIRHIDYNFNVLYPYRDKNFPLWINLKDNRFDKSVFGSMQFENLIKGRWWSLMTMFGHYTDEQTLIEKTIDDIIDLTQPYTQEANGK